MAEALGAQRTLIRWIPLWAIALWWTIRMTTTGRVSFETGISIGVFLHFGLVLVVALVAAFQVQGAGSFVDRFKASLTSHRALCNTRCRKYCCISPCRLR